MTSTEVAMTSADTAYAAMRLVHEGAEPTLERLAAIGGRKLATVARRAQAEGWQVPAMVDAEAMERRLGALQEKIVADLERLVVGLCEGTMSAVEKGVADGLTLLLKLIERMSATLHTGERARERQIRDDAELAAALDRIDERIRTVAGFATRDAAIGTGGGSVGA